MTVTESRTISTDFTVGNGVNAALFHAQCAADPTITAKFLGVNLDEPADNCHTVFTEALDGPELTAFNARVAAHDGTPSPPEVIEVVERGLELSSSKNGHPGKNVTANGALDIGWTIPSDFKTLVSMAILVSPGATAASADIDLSSNYCIVGEPLTQHAESNTTITYSLTIDIVAELDVSSVFSNLTARHICSLNLDLNGIGGSAHFLGSLLKYKP